MAMKEVFATPDLVNKVFWSIKYPNHRSTARALRNWVAVDRTIRDACKPDEGNVWWALFESAIDHVRMKSRKQFYPDSSTSMRLTAVQLRCMAAFMMGDEHPRRFFEFLVEVTRGVREHKELHVHFAADMDRAFQKRTGCGHDIWEVSALWETQAEWKKNIYKAFYPKEADRLEDGFGRKAAPFAILSFEELSGGESEEGSD
mmetsp:Transcript_20539/g.52100  ORF Transcript_20539/g.52100 Transcript_20539/m.52100 type:complete len:202 (+) Transcript_20539:93-698(+)